MYLGMGRGPAARGAAAAGTRRPPRARAGAPRAGRTVELRRTHAANYVEKTPILSTD